MVILEIDLKQYKRMKLRGITHLNIKPTSNIQLILGSNGSGKSSLLQELTPLPADHKSYLPGGSKKIIISHNGGIYTLTSDFTASPRHSFMIGSEELNPSGTVTIQRDLVLEHFGITTDIHELLYGDRHFTRMSPSERRRWFTYLSETSYDYGISVYNRVNSTHRDISGTLKRTKGRLLAETSKLVSEKELTNMQEEVDSLHGQISELLQQRIPMNESIGSSGNRVREGLEELENKSKAMITTAVNYLKQKRTNADSLEEAASIVESIISETDRTIAFKSGGLLENNKKLESINKSMSALEQTGSRDASEFTSRLIQLDVDENALRKKLILDLVFSDPEAAKDSYDAIEAVLTDICLNMPSNADGRFSKDELKHINDTSANLDHRLTDLNNELAQLKAKIEHQDLHKTKGTLNCPVCTHSWNPGFSEQQFTDLVNRDKAIKEEVVEIVAKRKVILDKKDIYSEYLSQFKNLTAIITSTPSLRDFWRMCESMNLLKTSPRKIVSLFESLKNDLGIHFTLVELGENRKQAQRLLKLAQETGELNLSELKLDKQMLEEVIFLAGQDLHTLNARLRELKAELSVIRAMSARQIELETLIRSSKESYDTHVENTRRSLFNELIVSLQSELALKEASLSRVKSQKHIIDDIEKQIGNLMLEERAAKLLVDELSPNNGLIAEGLIGFINSFVKQMNIFIRKVWMYSLIIQPCKTDEENGVDLDYKFPVVVQRANNIIPDVSKGSRSIEEIINLAFRITAMTYLDLSRAPVMLDEFSSSFDEAHRTTAMGVIKNIMERQQFSQLFMVNHYESTYGSLVNAEVTVICDENIALPKEMVYNKHVILERE